MAIDQIDLETLEDVSHVVHLVPQYRTDRLKTFDPQRGDTKKPAGEDVVPESQYHEVDPVALTVKVVTVPEVRTSYWEFDQTMRVGQPTECPDCTTGLASWTNADYPDTTGWKAGADLVFLACWHASRDVEPCHSGCLVACGRTAQEWAAIKEAWLKREAEREAALTGASARG